MKHNDQAPQFSTEGDDHSQEQRKTAEFYYRLQTVSAGSNAHLSITNIIIGLNIIAYIIIGLMGGGWITPDDMLVYVHYGANNGAATTNGEWWRLLTSMFMHYGILHIGVNMWALYQAGAFLEKLQGRLLYLHIYLACGVSGGIASLIWNGDKTWSAGASGAIFGVYGAILGYMLHERHTLPATVYKPIIKSTITFALYNIGFGIAMPGIDNSAHVGGILCGIITGFILAQPLDLGLRRHLRPRTALLTLTLSAAIGYCGYALTPRYNYSVTEELAWETTTDPLLKKYDSLSNALQTQLTINGNAADSHALASTLNQDMLPYLNEARAKIENMHYDPELLTSKRQKHLSDTLRQFQQNWTALGTALAAKTTNNYATYFYKNNQLTTTYIQNENTLKHAPLP